MRVLLDEQASTLQDPRVETVPGHVPELVVNLFKHVAQHALFYRLMVGNQGITLIEQTLQQLIEEFAHEQLSLPLPYSIPDQVPMPILCRSYAASFVGVLKWWLENDMPYPAEQMAAWLWETPTVIEGRRV